MSILSRWTSRLRDRRKLLADADRRLLGRREKHRFYHEKSRRPKAERAKLAARWHKLEDEAAKLVAQRKSQVADAERVVARYSSDDHLWGGARTVTNEITGIVAGRAPITSRKRMATFGNPGSDHHVSQKHADAVDFGVAEAHSLKNEISRRLGGPSPLADYGSFNVRRNGRTYRVQIIAGTHGTGPHLHCGARRQ